MSQHGHARVLVADDVDYYRRSREVFIKTPEQPMVYNTPVKYGCPYDCGLCPDHEQHSCLTLDSTGAIASARSRKREAVLRSSP